MLEALTIARTSDKLDDTIYALQILVPHGGVQWETEWLGLVIDSARKVGQIDDGEYVDEYGREPSLRHYAPDQILMQFLFAVDPRFQGELLTELLRQLRLSADQTHSADVLMQLLDYLPDELIKSNRAVFIEMTKHIAEDSWIQTLEKYQEILPVSVLKCGLGATLRQGAGNRFFGVQDVLDLALSGTPIYLLGSYGKNNDPVAGGPGDVLALLYNFNLLRPRRQRRQVTVMVPRLVAAGQTSRVQLNIGLAEGQSRIQLVPTRTIQLVVEMQSGDSAIRVENGRVRLVEVAWDKDVSPLSFEVYVSQLGRHSLHIKISSGHAELVVQKADIEVVLDAVEGASSDEFILTQSEFKVEPKDATR